MRAAENHRITQTAASSAAGQLLRHYWHPVALVDEFDPEIYPDSGSRPVKALEILGEQLVLFKDQDDRFGLLDRHCPHRGADLSFGRLEYRETSRWGAPLTGLRCPFHGWKFDVNGKCLDTPAEPAGSTLCTRIQAKHYPTIIRNRVIWGWLGSTEPPPLPDLDFLLAPESHTFAFKGVWNCNWLQAQEVGLDPAHTSFLHTFFEDQSLDGSYGKQFRNASAGSVNGEQWPMSRIMREFHRPDIQHEATPWGHRITTLRRINEKYTHVRITHGLFPNGFVIPLSESMTITQFHVPINDSQTWWFSLFTSFTEPIDCQTMRNQRLRGNPAPDFKPVKNAGNQWGFNAEEQAQRTMLGMGEEDINVHDQWACESMGAISDRTREHLGTTDKVIIANRRMLSAAITQIEQGQAVTTGFASKENMARCKGIDTIDGIAPSDSWQEWSSSQARRKRSQAPWNET